MKTRILILLIAVLGLNSNLQAQKNSQKIVTIEITTSAWNEACKKIVRKALAYEKGVTSTEFIENTQTIKCTYQPNKTTAEKIRTEISKIGFNADHVTADPKAYFRLPKDCKPSCCGYNRRVL
jgi:mercuric ion binding protein